MGARKSNLVVRRVQRAGRTSRLVTGALALLLTVLGGCGDDGIIGRLLLKPGHVIVERRPDAAYERLFPYYVELCAASQFRGKIAGTGGVAGHAVMYLKGACKDDGAPFPLLRRCRAVATSLGDPEHGAGISV